MNGATIRDARVLKSSARMPARCWAYPRDISAKAAALADHLLDVFGGARCGSSHHPDLQLHMRPMDAAAHVDLRQRSSAPC